MEIKKFSDIDNREYRSQIAEVYALTNDKNKVPGTTTANCLNEVFIILKDGSWDHFVANSKDINARTEETTDFLRLLENWSNQTGVTLSEPYFRQLQLGTQNKEKQRLIQELQDDYQDFLSQDSEDYEDEDSKKPLSFGKKAAIAAGAVGLATAIGVGGVAGYNHFKNRNDAIETQADENTLTKPDMEGQTWDYYVENAVDSTQKQFYTTLGDWLTNFNNSASWMSRTNNAGQSSTFGLTAKEGASLMLRFNEYTDEEMITICNGMNINADEIMEESNHAIEKLITYYTVSGTPTGIDTLFNDSHDKEVIQAFEQHHQQVMSATNDDEKESLMRAEKQMFYDYFNSDVEGKETKAEAASTSYLLRTILPADTIISQLNRYHDTEAIYKIGSSEPINVTTSLFGEQMMCQFELGWENFDQEAYLGELGYSSNKYYVKTDGAKRSIADISCGEQEKKLRDGDSYRLELTETNAAVDTAIQTMKLTLQADNKYSEEEINQIINQMENNLNDGKGYNSIDELTEYTYDRDLIEAMLDQKLKDLNKFPAYADTFDEVIEDMFLKQVSVKGSSKGSSSGGGSTVKSTGGQKVETTNPQEAEAALQAMGVSPEVSEQMRIEAEEKAAAAVGAERDTEEVKQKHEQQNELEEVEYQNIYNATFNYFAGENVKSTSKSFDGSWAYSSDARTRSSYEAGKADGLSYKQQKEAIKNEPTTGGEIKDDTLDDLKDQDIDVDNIGTDKGDSNGQTIDDIINAGNSEDPNKGNTIPGGGSDSGIIPPPPEDLNGGNNSGNDNGGNTGGDNENSNDGITNDPGDFSPVVPDDTTDDMTQNPDGTYGGETQIDDSVQESISAQPAPEVPSEAPTEAPSETPSNEITESTPETPAVEETLAVAETAPSTTVDQAIDAVVEETAQQIYEEQTMGGEVDLSEEYEGLEDYISNLGSEEVITPEEAETVKTIK